MFDAGSGLNRKPCLFYDMMIVHILRHAADAIATHLTLRTVRIEHAHAHIRPIGRTDQDQPVGTDAKMTVAHTSGKLCRIVCFVFQTIYINIIISTAMHLCKFHHPFSHPFILCSTLPPRQHFFLFYKNIIHGTF